MLPGEPGGVIGGTRWRSRCESTRDEHVTAPAARRHPRRRAPGRSLLGLRRRRRRGRRRGHGDDDVAQLPAGYAGHTSAVYADDANWLCKPGIADDVCSRDLDATAVAADGSTEVIEHEAADDPPVDCFYVYPTISRDPGPNSDLVPAEGEEIFTAYNQVARLTSTCRVYAPMYRQITLSQLAGGGGGFSGDARAVAYGDVVDAFKHYVANESDGRGFVLLGHSQGAGMITRLIQDEIDDEPLLRDRLVAAYVLGSSLQVPDGEVVGGDFANVPLCEAEDQTGCVVTYSSYRASEPPPAGGLFGRDRRGHGGGLREPGRDRRRRRAGAAVLPGPAGRRTRCSAARPPSPSPTRPARRRSRRRGSPTPTSSRPSASASPATRTSR